MSSSLDEMYREIIMDHFRAPRGKKPLEKADVSTGGRNPSCGDVIELEFKVDDGVLKDIHVDCKGCAISVASGSMLAEAVKGRPLSEVCELADNVRKMLKGEEASIPDEFEDLDALRGVRKFPVRIKCALLAWLALVEGMKNYRAGEQVQRTVVSTEHD